LHALKGMLLEAAPGGTIMAGLAKGTSGKVVPGEAVSLPPQATKNAAAAMGRILKSVVGCCMEVPHSWVAV
jgi:hypothetical protein